MKHRMRITTSFVLLASLLSVCSSQTSGSGKYQRRRFKSRRRRLANDQDTSPSGGEVIVHRPGDIFEGPVYSSPAWFGFPVYNGNFVGMLRYGATLEASEETGCTTCGCTPYSEDEFVFDAGPTSIGMIALIDRGECNFVDKVYNAQYSGAKGVIVVDNQSIAMLPIMDDDGTGARVHIPSVIISMNNGQLLKDQFLDHPDEIVEVEIAWGLPRPDHKVELDVWIPPNPDSDTVDFIETFSGIVGLLGSDDVDFRPVYKIYDPVTIGADQPWTSDGSEGACTNNGRYCWISDAITDGQFYIQQVLRQICVAKYGDSSGDISIWWRYMAEFDRTCRTQGGEGWSGPCGQDTLVGLASDRDFVPFVDRCIEDSGAFGDNNNTEFEEQIELWDSHFRYADYWPRVTLNQHEYHGSLRCEAPISPHTCGIFGALCASYHPDYLPLMCGGTPDPTVAPAIASGSQPTLPEIASTDEEDFLIPPPILGMAGYCLGQIHPEECATAATLKRCMLFEPFGCWWSHSGETIAPTNSPTVAPSQIVATSSPTLAPTIDIVGEIRESITDLSGQMTVKLTGLFAALEDMVTHLSSITSQRYDMADQNMEVVLTQIQTGFESLGGGASVESFECLHDSPDALVTVADGYDLYCSELDPIQYHDCAVPEARILCCKTCENY